MSASTKSLYPSLSTVHAGNESQYLSDFDLEQYLNDGIQDQLDWQLPPTPDFWIPNGEDPFNVLGMESSNLIPPHSYFLAQCQPLSFPDASQFLGDQPQIASLPRSDTALSIKGNATCSTASSTTSPPSPQSPSSPPNLPSPRTSFKSQPHNGFSNEMSTSPPENEKELRVPRKRGRKPKPQTDETKNHRKELNRLAAERCRAKKRVWVDQLVEKVGSLGEENVSLRVPVESLSNDIKVLRSMARDHNLSHELTN